MKKTKLLLLAITLVASYTLKAQVAINTKATAPHNSAMLDVSSDTAGILIPRLSSAQRNAISVPATGLLIFQTDNTPGFYYYNGASWSLIGTEAFAIDDLADGRTIGNSVFLGSGAGVNDDGTSNRNVAVGRAALNANTTGYYNTATGFQALLYNTTGIHNTAYGYQALMNDTTGNKNIAIGYRALFSSTIGYRNTAIGYQALWSNTTGFQNTANGYEANYFNEKGINNTIIGYQAGRGTSAHNKSGNVFLGYRAGYNETTDNKLYIENSGSASPLIYGEFDNDILAFNASVGIGTSNPNAKLDVRGSGTDNAAMIIVGNSDGSHRLSFFPGRENDPNPFIQWKEGDPLRFSTDEGGWSEKMRIQSDGRVGIGTYAPDESALLDLNSNSLGFLLPRLSVVEIAAINTPADGLQVYNTTDGKLYIYVSISGNWRQIDYGMNSLSSDCGFPITDSRDGKSYNTVKIGEQCWMAENLNIGDTVNGINDQSHNGAIEKYCYDDDTLNCDTYGGLYQWAEMVLYLNGATNTTSWSPVPTGDVQGICPTGWHIPTDIEWQTLEMFLGMTPMEVISTEWRGTNEGGKLKEAGTTHWTSPNIGATNSSNFKAFPGGNRASNGLFSNLANYGTWWSSSDHSGSTAWPRYLGYDHDQVYRLYDQKTIGRSVRCLKD